MRERASAASVRDLMRAGALVGQAIDIVAQGPEGRAIPYRGSKLFHEIRDMGDRKERDFFDSLHDFPPRVERLLQNGIMRVARLRKSCEHGSSFQQRTAVTAA